MSWNLDTLRNCYTHWSSKFQRFESFLPFRQFIFLVKYILGIVDNQNILISDPRIIFFDKQLMIMMWADKKWFYRWSVRNLWPHVNHQRSLVTLSEDTVHQEAIMMSALPPRSGESPRRGTSRLEMMQVGAKLNILNCSLWILPDCDFKEEKSLTIFTTELSSFSNLTERKIIKTILVKRHHLVFWRAVNHFITWQCNCQSQ